MRVFRLHADQQRHRPAVDLRLRGDGAPGTNFEPEVRHDLRAALPGGAERNGPAQLRPFAARRNLDERVVAELRLQRIGLLVDQAVEHRLHLAGIAEL